MGLNSGGEKRVGSQSPWVQLLALPLLGSLSESGELSGYERDNPMFHVCEAGR